MFDGIRSGRGLRKITQAWFWEDVRDGVSEFVRSRAVWVVVGNVGTFLSALAGLVHYWSRPASFADAAVLQLVCAAWQAVALFPVVLPGRAATERDVVGLGDLHQGMTVLTVCGSWIFGVFPGLGLLVFLDADVDGPLWAALFVSGTTLMLACVAGLMTATAVSDTVRARHRGTAAPPGGSGWYGGDDGTDTADVDAGGSDGD
ncbi:hypothetical protein ACIA8J_14905 [Streptomyces asoensis]|uniref:hypothetical protein n=1 Tax=Streptomyces asoensis TaxID=249586 RepID=UPI0037A256FE